MKKINLLKGASLLTAILMCSMFFAPIVTAGPVDPYNRWGYAYDSGGTELDSEEIYSWINGTCYGSTTTFSAPNVGLFTLDTYGDDTTPDFIKTGGYNGDPVQYSWGDLTDPADTFFIENDAWLVGGFINGDLNENAGSPTLLKINNISTNSGIMYDYVGIYDPTGTADVTEYSIRIGTASPQPILAGDIVDTRAQLTHVDMAGFAGFGNDHAISLIHTATGYYVDRVEYGTIGAEPEDTNPLGFTGNDNAANPAAGMEIYRSGGAGIDTNHHGNDFGSQMAVNWFSPPPTATISNVLPPSPTNDNTPDFVYAHTGSPTFVDFYYYTTGPWTFFGTDATIEVPAGTWTSPVLADGTYYFAAVANGGPIDPVPSVAPPGGDEEWGPYVINTNYTINLHIGWNLISLPLIQSDENLGVALDNITGKWDYIQAYDTLDPDHWKTNATFKPDQLNDLKSLNHSIGFWINITEANVNLTVYGLIPLYTEIPLYAGWNLVGYPSLTPRSVSLALAGTGYDGVEGFNATDLYRLSPLPGTYMMGPGEGYWVHVPADTNWIIDW